MFGLRKTLLAATLGLAALACAPVPVDAQAAGEILVLNQDRLLTQTLFGQRIQQELEEASSALSCD